MVGLVLASAAPAVAYDWTYSCLDVPSDQGFALRLAVGPDGELHLARLQRVVGNLQYTRVGPDNVTASQLVAGGISNFGANEVSGVDVELFGGVPHLCFYDVRQDRISVAIGSAMPGGAFNTEVVFAGPGAHDDCALFTVGGRVGVAFNTNAGLQVAMRVGANQWVREAVDAGRNGHDVDAATLDNGEVVLAHREEPGWDLRISIRGLNGAWRTLAVPRVGPEWAQTPSVVPVAGGAFRVFHGLRPQDSDNGLVRTSVSAAGAIASEIISGADAVGGTLMAGRFVEGEAVLTRELRRSALFGANDGLQFYDEAGRDTLASHSAAEQRRKYQFINARRDPFGLPVLAMYDERSPFAGQQAGAFVCLYRPTDTDADRIPDSEEARIGTRIDQADTDGDGVSDGIEYLVDRTDPRGPGDLPPLDAGVLPDVGVGPDAFVPPVDAGPLPDAGPVPDAALPMDQGPPPADRGVDRGADAAPLDASPADRGPRQDAAAGEDGGETADALIDADVETDLGGDLDGGVDDATPGTDATPRRDARTPRPDAERRLDFGRVDARAPRADADALPEDDTAAGGCSATSTGSTPAGGTLAGALLALCGLRRRRRRHPAPRP